MTEGKDNLEDSAAPLIEHLTEQTTINLFSFGFHRSHARLLHSMEANF